MRLSKKFLNDYVKVDDIDTKELAEKMVYAGNEYESIEGIASAKGVVVGYVKKCMNHPHSDHLHICTVDYGEGDKTIVCGAPNVKEGIKVIVAKVGAVLGGAILKEATLAGTVSEGMICALDELGIDSKYLKEEDSAGIHILPEDAPIGDDAIEYLGLDDEVIDFELTANRADLLSVLGMAYEVGAIYDRPVTEPTISYTEVNSNIEESMHLSVETDACFIYLGKLVENVEIKESPLFIKNRLIASGIRPINNVVDISNYVMLEYGQPLHFFDRDALGNDVIVRLAKEGETLQTLDGKERTLTEEDIVIASPSKALCLAGVMGGLSTEVEKDTQNIFIEAAIFESSKIRRTSNRILRSEASSRYEKGVDPSRCQKAIERACQLLEMYASGKVASGMLSYDQTSKEDKKIIVSLERIRKILGLPITKEEVGEAFRKLGFSYKEEETGVFTVLVPTRRLDVNLECDLFEEVGRIHGYEHLQGTIPVTTVKRGGYSHKGEVIRTLRNRLSSYGLHEVRTYSLINEKQSHQFPFREYDKISILSPLTEDRKILRRSLIPSHLEVYHYNIAHSVKDISTFEIASSYYKIEGEYIEETMISGLLAGTLLENTWNGVQNKADFYTVKGIVTDLLDYMGLKDRYSFSTENVLKDLHPYQSAYVLVDREIVGYIGKVHPELEKKDVYVFELSLDKLMTKKVRNIKYKEVSKYPSVHKDLAFVVDENVPSLEISQILKRVGGRLLSDITIFDVYRGENVGENEKSIAYALTFRDANRTLSDEEVTIIFNKMIAEVESKCKAKLRTS